MVRIGAPRRSAAREYTVFKAPYGAICDLKCIKRRAGCGAGFGRFKGAPRRVRRP